MGIKAGIVGAAGYAGIECVRILTAHPMFELVYAASDSEKGKRICDVYPALAGRSDLGFEGSDVDAIASRCDVVFLATPHTVSLDLTPRLIESGCTVIDLSADYRLKNPGVYGTWYGTEHTSPALLECAVYGLPEENHDELTALAGSATRLVACAGCFPTASALAALPLLHAGLLEGDRVISDCVSGISGAGRTPRQRTVYGSTSENACAYGVASHRHTPEMEQAMSFAAGRCIDVVFTPHLVPMVRGLLSTVYLPVAAGTSPSRIEALYESFYASSPFVTVLPEGAMPETSNVRGGNNAQIGLACNEASSVLIASCAIDNLMKGAAGQAVQCANLVYGLPEDAGLVSLLPTVI